MRDETRGSRQHCGRLRAALQGLAAVTLALFAGTAGPLCAAPDPAPGATPSFCREPYIHPLIVKDLLAWLSDGGDQVVAINLLESNDSNRYFGTPKVEPSTIKALRTPRISLQSKETAGGEEETSEVGYQYVGLTRSGVHVLSTWEWGAGTMVSKQLLLVTIEEDRGLNDVETIQSSHLQLGRRRLLIRKLGEIVLGDRWDGELAVDGNKILVGKDHGWFSAESWAPYNRKDVVLELDDDASRPGVLAPCP